MIERPRRFSTRMPWAFIAMSEVPATAPDRTMQAARAGRLGIQEMATVMARKAPISVSAVALVPKRATARPAKGMVAMAPMEDMSRAIPSFPADRCRWSDSHGRREENVPVTAPCVANTVATDRRSFSHMCCLRPWPRPPLTRRDLIVGLRLVDL